MQEKISINYERLDNISQLNEQDTNLVIEARKAATAKAYVPYSKFHVGAAALLANGTILSAANQENASYPATICAERTLLGAISSVANGATIQTMAISYFNENGSSFDPISPCGVCRQVLSEREKTQNLPIRIILSGYEENSPILILDNTASLLPFAFSSDDMK